MGTAKNQTDRTQPEFELGTTCVTRGVHQDVSKAEVFLVLSRHLRGDWGDLCDEDRKSNEDALKTGARLFSAYKLSDDRKVWVITEAKDDDGRRQATTVLFPDEY